MANDAMVDLSNTLDSAVCAQGVGYSVHRLQRASATACIGYSVHRLQRASAGGARLGACFNRSGASAPLTRGGCGFLLGVRGLH